MLYELSDELVAQLKEVADPKKWDRYDGFIGEANPLRVAQNVLKCEHPGMISPDKHPGGSRD